MNEIRQNKATKEWAIFAPARGRRPKDFATKREKKEELPERDDSCPFCPGNERELPPIITEVGSRGGRGWQTRVIPNKYPALTPVGGTERARREIYLTLPGYGKHEVIIESPLHNRDLSVISPEEVGNVVDTYHCRYIELMKEHENMMIIVFRNHGTRAGTSIIHPHSQLIVTGIVPRHIRLREEEAERYFDEWGRCVYCDIIQFESTHPERVIMENDSFCSFVPFAAEVPFEIWIMPKRHNSDFAAITDAEKADLSLALSDSLGRLYKKLGNPDYNYVINTAARYRSEEPHLHWYVQIRPRLTTPAGFEIGSGIQINPSLPEEDAGFLREE